MARPVSNSPVNFPLIRHVLKARELTLTALSEAIGMQVSHLSEALTGKRSLSDDRLRQIAEVCSVQPDYFRSSTGRLLLTKAEMDIVDFSLTDGRGDVKELEDYIELGSKLGMLAFGSADDDEVADLALDHWKKPSILPFTSDNCLAFWSFVGDEILIRGPARCGKSTLILEWLIALHFANPGLKSGVFRAFSVDLDAVRQNIRDIVRHRFESPLSSIKAFGGTKFETLFIADGEMHLKGIDRAEGQLGAGYDVGVFSQAEQMKKKDVDVIASRITPASQNWMEEETARSLAVYDANPNRLDNWLEKEIDKGLPMLSFTFRDHPGYFTEDGEETALFKSVYSRLDRLEGVTRTRLLEGKSANPEGTVFELEDCHLLDALPDNFHREHLFYRGFDFGMKDPNVILWFALHRHTGDLIVYREWRRVGVDTLVMGEASKRHTPAEERILATVQDNDENLQSILKKNCGIVTVMARKGPNSIGSGLALIEHRLQCARDGEDGGLYFYDNPVGRCPKLTADNQPLTTIQEGDVYSWNANKDAPQDKYNHGWDIIRYMLDYLESQQGFTSFAVGAAKRKTRV